MILTDETTKRKSVNRVRGTGDDFGVESKKNILPTELDE